MSQPQHTYTLRKEVGFGLRLAMSALGEPHEIQIENFKSSFDIGVRTTTDSLASLRAASLWKQFDVPTGVLTPIPVGVRQVAVEIRGISSPNSPAPTVFHLPGFFRGAEQAQYYGVDVLDSDALLPFQTDFLVATSGSVEILEGNKLRLGTDWGVNNGVFCGDSLDINDAPIIGEFVVTEVVETIVPGDTLVLSPPHNAADDPAEFLSPININYDASVVGELLATGVAVNVSTASAIIKSSGTWGAIDVFEGDTLRFENGATANGDFRVRDITLGDTIINSVGAGHGLPTGLDTVDIRVLKRPC